MKQIKAIVRPEMLDAAKDALVEHGVKGITIEPVKGFGRQLGYPEVYRGVPIEARLLPKLLITLVVPDAEAQSVSDVIQRVCKTGAVGDGKIIITTVEQAIRIRTGETGDASLG